MPTAMIIGAGLSGLTAGFYLQRAGWSVRIIEAGDRPGGRVRTDRVDGFVIDTGPDATTESYTHFYALLDLLGMSDRKVLSSPVIGIIRGGRIIDIDPARPISAMLTPALSLGAKLRFAWGAYRLRKQIAATDSFALLDHAADDDPQSNAYLFAQEHFGRELADYLFDPMSRLTTGTSARGATSLMVLGGLASWTAALCNLSDGLDLLPHALAKELDVEFGARANLVERRNGGVFVRYINRDGQTIEAEADAAVVASQIDAACAITPEFAGRIGDLEPAIPPLSLVSISLAYDRPTRSRAYVVQVPTVEFPDQLLMFLQHNKAPDRAPPGKSLVTYYIDNAAAKRYLAMNDEEIRGHARDFVESLMPELAGSLRFIHISRWPRAGSLAVPGYFKTVKEIISRLDRYGPIQLAGDFYAAGSMETAVRTGKQAAENLIRPNSPI